jgi:hypothetical protein
MKYFLPILFSSLGCLGCDQYHGDTFNLVIDPAFTSTQREMIVAGAEDWAGKIPELTIASIKYQICPDPRPEGVVCYHPIQSLPIPSDICNYGHVEPTFVGVTCHPGNGGDIYVWTGESAFQVDAEHELGHAMGLAHEGTFNLMSAEYPAGLTQANCNDIAQWYHVREMVVPLCDSISVLREVPPSIFGE